MMFKYILLCTLLSHIIWAQPVHQHADLPPHVLIVTPQAQLRLESLIPGTPIIQHLSPFTRFIAPHEETIVYVPASAAAATIQPLQYTEVVARSLPSSAARQDYSEIASNAQEAILAGSTQLQQALQSGFQNAGTLIAGSTSSFAPAGVDYSPVVQGLTSAANAAAAAGSSLAGAASFAPAGVDYSPVVQGLTSAASAAAAAGSSLAGAASFAPAGADYSPVVSALIEQGPSVLSSAATAATAAAASAGSSFVSGFTQAASLSSSSPSSSSPTSASPQSSLSSSAPLEPSPLPAPSLPSPSSPNASSGKLSSPSLNKLPTSSKKIEKIEYEIPITPILSNEPRHHYVIAPAVPHIVDIVQGPILLAPSISTIKSRSLLEADNKEKPIIGIPLPELPKPDALPVTTNDLDKGELLKEFDEKEKKIEFKRFLEANALKEDSKQDVLNLKDQIKPAEDQKSDKINFEKTKPEQKSAPIANNEENEKPQTKVA